MNTQHTAGPWRVSMPHIKTQGGLGYLATVSNNPQAIADANLIAAAPELLAIVERLQAIINRGGDIAKGPKGSEHDLRAQVEAAILKATGGQS